MSKSPNPWEIRYEISVNATAVMSTALQNLFLFCWEYDMDWVVVKSKFKFC